MERNRDKRLYFFEGAARQRQGELVRKQLAERVSGGERAGELRLPNQIAHRRLEQEAAEYPPERQRRDPAPTTLTPWVRYGVIRSPRS